MSESEYEPVTLVGLYASRCTLFPPYNARMTNCDHPSTHVKYILGVFLWTPVSLFQYKECLLVGDGIHRVCVYQTVTPHPLLKLPHIVEGGRRWRCYHLPVNFSSPFTIVLSPLVAFSLAFFWSRHLFLGVPSTPRSPSQNASSGYYTPRARQFYYSVREKARPTKCSVLRRTDQAAGWETEQLI